MITAQKSSPRPEQPTIWGLKPTELHDRFWAARGVQVVRQGERSQIVPHAELFLLSDPRTLVVFKLAKLVDRLSWLSPDLMLIRLHETRDHGYREMVLTDHEDRFVRFRRIYGASDSRMTRVALTPDRRIAEVWQGAAGSRVGWRQLRRRIPRPRRMIVSEPGNVYDRRSDDDVMQCLHDLIQVWRSPDATIHRARPSGQGVWTDRETRLDPAVRFIGPAWVGAGRSDLPATSVVGPAVLWDAPEQRPAVEDVEWQELEPSPVFERPVEVRRRSSFYRITKRAFDIVFSFLVLLACLPLLPVVALAIMIEDGWPVLFTHRRETTGGREFPCIKFRSMRKDADRITEQLINQNRADGPQFFIEPEEDPRLTRVGAFLRKANIDELPQFVNVLLGQMSVVGPRPSPRAENQCCPPWREARLSVRPGITGLWQVMRTRQQGLDFQEWIKYDIEYVEKAGWLMDLHILWKTALIMLRLSD